MAKKKQIKVIPSNKTIEVDGVEYRPKKAKYQKTDGIEHIECLIYEEVDDKEYKTKIDFIKKKLKNKLSAERIVEEVVKDLPIPKINKIYNLLKDKKTKIKRHDGCLGLHIKNKKKKAYIELFD